MKTNELLEKHPLSTEVVRTWFFDQMTASFADENVPEEFKEMMKQEGVTNERLATFIDVQPRTLFDVFDDNELFIYINRRDSNFEYGINELSFFLDGSWNTRKEAEAAAIESAFKLLESKLTPKELIDETDN